jgi:hypothetical protein
MTGRHNRQLFISHSVSLTDLNVKLLLKITGNNAIYISRLCRVCRCFRHITPVTSITFNNIKTSDITITSLLLFLSKITHIKELSFSGSYMKDNILELILQNMTQLTKINLSSNDIVHPKWLKNMPQLTECNMAYNLLGYMNSDMTFIECLFKGNPKLTRVNLASNFLNAKCIIAVANTLIQLTQLTHLNLRCNNIRFEGACALANVLKGLNKLVWIDISENYITNPGINIVIESITHNIEHLSISNNALINMPNIKHLSKLLFLDVSYNTFLNISSLAHSLIPSITFINLSHNNINYIDILIPVFEQMHGPITIELTKNTIPLQEALRLLCALRNIKNPVSINLQDNQLSLSDKTYIKKFVININKLSNNNFTLDI